MNNPELTAWLLAPDGIARRLREMRSAAGRGNEIAAAAGMPASKLSKLELGQQAPTDNDIRAIVAAAGQPTEAADELVKKLAEAPAVQAQARINRFGQAATQRRLNQILAGATSVRLFDCTYLPRPVQTLDYATEVLKATAQARGIRSEPEAAALLYTAAGYLLQKQCSFQMVVTEPVLRWQILQPAAMKAQLERLLELGAMSNVDLRVIALGRPTVVLPQTSFGLVDDRGYADTLEGADELTGGRLVGHQRRMDELAKTALNWHDSAELIRSVLAQTNTSAIAVRFNSGAH
jgi:transcriptional regulator with XRE-family HTH domain